MNAVANVVMRAVPETRTASSLKTIAIFCGIGLLGSLFFAAYGLDLSAGFFW